MLPPSEATAEFTPSEVATHNTAADCWVIVHGRVVDVTQFLSEHPGGKAALSKPGRAGQDVTSHFERIGHSDNARQRLAKMCVGVVLTTDVKAGDLANDIPLAGSGLPYDHSVAWHGARRAAILKAHPEVAALSGHNPWTPFIGLLASAVHSLVALRCGGALFVGTQPLSWWAVIFVAYTVGAVCKMMHFAVCHDICHGTAGSWCEARWVRQLFIHLCTLPSFGGETQHYYQYQVSLTVASADALCHTPTPPPNRDAGTSTCTRELSSHDLTPPFTTLSSRFTHQHIGHHAALGDLQLVTATQVVSTRSSTDVAQAGDPPNSMEPRAAPIAAAQLLEEGHGLPSQAQLATATGREGETVGGHAPRASQPSLAVPRDAPPPPAPPRVLQEAATAVRDAGVATEYAFSLDQVDGDLPSPGSLLLLAFSSVGVKRASAEIQALVRAQRPEGGGLHGGRPRGGQLHDEGGIHATSTLPLAKADSANEQDAEQDAPAAKPLTRCERWMYLWLDPAGWRARLLAQPLMQISHMTFLTLGQLFLGVMVNPLVMIIALFAVTAPSRCVVSASRCCLGTAIASGIQGIYDELPKALDAGGGAGRDIFWDALGLGFHTWLWSLALVALWFAAGWAAVVYLLLSELFLHGFCFHPYAGFFLGVHRSELASGREAECQPTMSTYSIFASILSLNLTHHVEVRQLLATVYDSSGVQKPVSMLKPRGFDTSLLPASCVPSCSTHAFPARSSLLFSQRSAGSFAPQSVQHHDFPTVPWSRLPLITKAAPEFYDSLYSSPGFTTTIRRWLTSGSEWHYACTALSQTHVQGKA